MKDHREPCPSSAFPGRNWPRGGLLASLGDYLFAHFHYGWRLGVFQNEAGALIGLKAARAGGVPMYLLRTELHFLVGVIWAAIFWGFARRLTALLKYALARRTALRTRGLPGQEVQGAAAVRAFRAAETAAARLVAGGGSTCFSWDRRSRWPPGNRRGPIFFSLVSLPAGAQRARTNGFIYPFQTESV